MSVDKDRLSLVLNMSAPWLRITSYVKKIAILHPRRTCKLILD